MDEQVPPKDDTSAELPDSTPDHEADYAEASHSTADFVKNVTPIQEKKQKGHKKALRILVVLVILGALGGAGYVAYKSLTKPQPTQQPTQNTQQQAAPATNDTDLSEHYQSQDLKLSFDHPKSWKITDSSSGQLKLTSPVVKLKSASGQTTDAKVVMAILSNPTSLTGFSAVSTAVTASEKIAYTSPTQSQRQETFLSFIGSSSTSQGIDAIFITGDSGYQKGQAVQKADVTKVQPIVSLQFYACDAACEGEGAGPLSLSVDEWNTNTVLQTAKAIVRSLVIE